jgi:hypothetical protein
MLNATRPARPAQSRSVSIGDVSAEDAISGFYLAITPGQRCNCLYLTHLDGAITGHLESLYLIQSSNTLMCTRMTIAAKGNGSVMSFGNIIAIRTPEGYKLTSHTRLGRIRQQRFIRTEVQDIKSAVALGSFLSMHAILPEPCSISEAH